MEVVVYFFHSPSFTAGPGTLALIASKALNPLSANKGEGGGHASERERVQGGEQE
jgi:hypothetical protein